MTTKNIQAILFDYGGVLAEEGFHNGLLQFAAEQKLDVDMPLEGMKAVYDSGYVLGQGSVHDFWQLLRQRTGLHGDDEDLTNRILQGSILRDAVTEQVRQLRAQGYITGILSDQTRWLDELDQRDHFYRYFDKIYNSYDLGKGKQDASIFSDVVNDLGLDPGQVLFVDDNAGNIERAMQAGLRTIHYLDQEKFNAELNQLLNLHN